MTVVNDAAPAVGRPASPFSLPDTSGRTHDLGDAPATVIVFTCNHCPYALAWHERIVAAARDYADRGVVTLAINSNDAERYPGDSPQAMRERVARGEFDGIPYLRDETQAVARAWDAKTTPDLFVVDSERIVRYRGAPDADQDEPALEAAWLRGALDAVLGGRDPAPAETPPVGCTVKWRR